MVPDAWELFEICFSIFLLAEGGRGAEEGDGLAGEGLSADEVAFLAIRHGMAVGGKGGDGHAEAFALDFSCIDRDEGARGAKEGDDVSSACD